MTRIAENKITEMWLFIAEEKNGMEGIPAVNIDGLMMPLIASDEKRLDLIRIYAEAVAQNRGIRMELRRYVLAETCEIIGEKTDVDTPEPDHPARTENE